MPKAIVTADVYRYYEETGNAESGVLEAEKGAEIDVSEKELKRGLEMHERDGVGLVKPRSKDAKEAKAEAADEAEAEPAA
jgi:hypothetical protein